MLVFANYYVTDVERRRKMCRIAPGIAKNVKLQWGIFVENMKVFTKYKKMCLLTLTFGERVKRLYIFRKWFLAYFRWAVLWGWSLFLEGL